jgi:gamma-glutamyltranspeptidase/glutathione hydrolase
VGLDAPPLIRRWPLLLVASFLIATAGRAPPPAEAGRGMVAADHALASEAGAEILQRGGNAVDAAVAAALAAGVVQPSGSGLGGGGFAIVSGADGVHVLDFRETAPANATPAMFQNGVSSREGGAAIATPGEGPGLALLVEKWGSLSRKEIAAPALRYARRWFPAGGHLVGALGDLGDARVPIEYGVFGKAGVQEGDDVRRERLAHAIKAWADRGGREFQQGWIAEDIVDTAKAAGGILTVQDLASWSPKERTPLVGSYRGWRVETFPSPSGGPVLLEMLGVLEGYPLATMDPRGAAYFHLLAETMKHGFADRARFFGDPDRTSIPVAAILSPARRDAIRASFDPDHTFGPDHYGMAAEPPEDHGTEHISVVAGAMAVGLTTTVNLPFGSHVVAARSGIVLNDQMDDFATTAGPDSPNAVVPGARPLSSMSPTVLTSADGRTRIASGASGGQLIIRAGLQVILDVVDFGMDPAAAVQAPRIHDGWKPNVLKAENLAPETIAALRAKGHEVQETTFSSSVQVAAEKDGRYRGASDPRRGGAPALAR